MALPETISSLAETYKHPNGGPFKSGSSFYILVSLSNDPSIATSTDPGVDGFGTVDSANRPNGNSTGPGSSMHSILDGTTIHIATQSTATGDPVDYHTFSCSSDTWSITDESVLSSISSEQHFASISLRSDGDVIIAYMGPMEANMGTDYDRVDLARRETGSWTTGVSIDGLGKTQTRMQDPFVVRADSTNDRMHIFYLDVTGDGLHYSTYLSGNTWGHQHTEADTTIANATIYARGIAFDDGGTTKVRFVYSDSATNTSSIVGFNDANDPGASISIATDITGSEPAVQSGRALAVDDATDTQYFISEDGSNNLDVSETGSGDDTWTTDTDELTGLSTPEVFSANIYDHGGTVLAYLYKDGSNFRYNERSIAAVAGFTFLPPHRRQPNLRF